MSDNILNEVHDINGNVWPDQLVKEWDISNGPMTAVSMNSSDKVLWNCSGCITCFDGQHHQWWASIRNRVRNNSGCPVCVKRGPNTLCIRDACNSLYYNVPGDKQHLYNEWHDHRSMKEFTKNSNEVVLFRCGNGHVFPARIDRRTERNGTNCHLCQHVEQMILVDNLRTELIDFYDVEYEVAYEWSLGMVYDIGVEQERLNIEVDAPYHYRRKETKESDKVKTLLSISHGYSVMHITNDDVTEDATETINAILHVIHDRTIDKRHRQQAVLYIRYHDQDKYQHLIDAMEESGLNTIFF